MKVAVTHYVELSKADETNIVRSFLKKLAGNYWISDGHLWEEVATSHKFDMKVAPVDDPKYAIQVAAIRLLKSLPV